MAYNDPRGMPPADYIMIGMRNMTNPERAELSARLGFPERQDLARMDPETVGPALTPEEWDAARGRLSWQQEMGVEPPMRDAIDSAAAALCNIPVAPARRHHALAALALDGQSFGFTREDVALLRYLTSGQCLHDGGPGLDGEHWIEATFDADEAARLRSLVARIAALLPQE